MIPRLKEQFNTELKTSVMEQLSLNNVNEIPTLDKIIINIGDGKAATDGRALESMIETSKTTRSNNAGRCNRQEYANRCLQRCFSCQEKVRQSEL